MAHNLTRVRCGGTGAASEEASARRPRGLGRLLPEVTGGSGRWRVERRSRPHLALLYGKWCGARRKIPAKDPKRAGNPWTRRARGHSGAGTASSSQVSPAAAGGVGGRPVGSAPARRAQRASGWLAGLALGLAGEAASPRPASARVSPPEKSLCSPESLSADPRGRPPGVGGGMGGVPVSSSRFGTGLRSHPGGIQALGSPSGRAVGGGNFPGWRGGRSQTSGAGPQFFPPSWGSQFNDLTSLHPCGLGSGRQTGWVSDGSPRPCQAGNPTAQPAAGSPLVVGLMWRQVWELLPNPCLCFRSPLRPSQASGEGYLVSPWFYLPSFRLLLAT